MLGNSCSQYDDKVAGIFNLAIEGTMLICALTGVIASVYAEPVDRLPDGRWA